LYQGLSGLVIGGGTATWGSNSSELYILLFSGGKHKNSINLASKRQKQKYSAI
jgi:hypothetical protein